MSWATAPPSPGEEGRAMPRFYSGIVRPSANKAIAPGQEKKGGKPADPPKKPDDKKDEGGEK